MWPTRHDRKRKLTGHDGRVVCARLHHLLELLQLLGHPGLVLEHGGLHARPERLLPHGHARGVEAVQPALVLRVVRAADVVRAAAQQQRQVKVQLLVRRRTPRLGPLRVVIPPVQLHHRAVQRHATTSRRAPHTQPEALLQGLRFKCGKHRI